MTPATTTMRTAEAVSTVNRAVEDAAWRLIVALSATTPGDLPAGYRTAARRLLDDAITLLYGAAPYLDSDDPRSAQP